MSSGRSRKGKVGTRFERVSWHPWFNGVCLNIEDPTRKTVSSTITAGWYFGSEEQHALPIVVSLVNKVQNFFGIANEDTYFIGSSSGGFAALWLADAIEGAIGIAGNPQFYVRNWPDSKRFSKVNIDLNNNSFEDRLNLDHLKLNKRSRFVSVVNVKSKRDYEQQLIPLLQRWGLSPVRYGVNNYGNFHIYCRSNNNGGVNSPHHAFDNVHEFQLLLNLYELKTDTATKAKFLNSVQEMQSNRLSLQDKIFYTKLWAKFLSKARLPILIPWDSLDANTANFPLKRYRNRVYYNVSWGEQAKTVVISIRAKQKDKEVAAVFRRLAELGFGKHLCKNGVRILSNGRIDCALSKVQFTDFVRRTSRELYSNQISGERVDNPPLGVTSFDSDNRK
ncbi:hypothetical protein [Pseudovibrio sp. FO-BEG1]|uniref:hypothetical protein n=1 Tax=Pseudovibrio sp. (strain FO-BEG1) TaxID=911045 RepID=UPI0011D29FBE|nr:hypothetical protein [Pseudovibrio sp. FO-BEG1]